MNSETIRDANLGVDKIGLEIQRDRLQQSRLKTLAAGNEAEDFMGHPHWQRLVKDGEDLKQKLIKDLRDSKHTLKTINLIQKELDILEWLLNNPKGYILKRNVELNRR